VLTTFNRIDSKELPKLAFQKNPKGHQDIGNTRRKTQSDLMNGGQKRKYIRCTCMMEWKLEVLRIQQFSMLRCAAFWEILTCVSSLSLQHSKVQRIWVSGSGSQEDIKNIIWAPFYEVI